MKGFRAGVAAIAIVALSTSAGAVFGRIYHGPLLFQLVVGAAVAAVGLSVLLRLVRVPASIAVLTSIAALAGYLAVAAVLAKTPDGGALSEVYLDALRNSGARILTSTFPVEPAPDTVFLPVLVVWAAALAGAELAIRGGRLVLGFVPPALAYGLALAFVGPNARPSVWLAVAFLGVAAIATALTREDVAAAGLRQLPAGQRVAYRGKGTVIGAVALVLLLGATLAIGTTVADLRKQTPKDPRTYVAPPQQEEPESNPLGRLSGWARQPAQHLFDITMTEPSRIRWVVLSDYDGLSWTPHGQYRSAGSVLPAAGGTGGGPKTSVPQQVTIAELDGVWLPALDEPREVTGVRVSYDSDTGTLLQPNGLEPGLRYDVTSELAKPDLNQAQRAGTPGGAAFSRYLAVPAKVPDEIREMTDEVTKTGSTPYNKALQLEAHLTKQYRFQPEAPSGHGFPNLEFFLAGAPEQGGRRGTSEQFAAAFALMARLAGLPTRVVMGFHAGRKQGDNAYRVSSGDAFAWPEVYFQGQGWVAFDPTPSAGQNVEKPLDEQTKEAEKQKQAKAEQLDAIEDEQAPTSDLTPEEPKAKPKTEISTPVRIAIGAGVALLVIVVAVGTLLLLRRRVRRRRLTRGTPSERVVGAWWELLDALRLGRRRPAAHLAAAEVAALAAEPVAGRPGELPPVGDLAALVNLVAFAPGLADDADAGTAGRLATEYAAALRRRRSWWRRWLWSVDPRPLFWGTRTAPAPATAASRPEDAAPPAGQDGVGAGGEAFAPSRAVHTESEFARTSTETAAATTKQ